MVQIKLNNPSVCHLTLLVTESRPEKRVWLQDGRLLGTSGSDISIVPDATFCLRVLSTCDVPTWVAVAMLETAVSTETKIMIQGNNSWEEAKVKSYAELYDAIGSEKHPIVIKDPSTGIMKTCRGLPYGHECHMDGEDGVVLVYIRRKI